MSKFLFNSFFVIESLLDDERHTGEELYNDLIQYQPYKYSALKVLYQQVDSKEEFLRLLEDIAIECEQSGMSPVLHFELHGDSESKGLVTKSHELVSWHELALRLRNINIRTKNNLFVTLAVCHGAFLMEEGKIDEPSPFYGFIGSFDVITNSDLYIRYMGFYQELFDSFDVNKALEALHKANPDLPSSYRYINCELLFARVYKDYVTKQLTPEAIKRRAEKSIPKYLERNIRHKQLAQFIAMCNRTKDQYYQDSRNKFFMIDLYSDIEKNFAIPPTLNEFTKCELWSLV